MRHKLFVLPAAVLGLAVLALFPSAAQAKYFITSEIEIDAPQEKVWAVLTDIESWEQWNPFIRSAHGKLEKGNTIDVIVQPTGTKPLKGKGKVMVFEPPHEMVWTAKLLAGFVFKGEHHFAVEALPGGRSKFVQSEYFKGMLVPLVKGKINRETKPGFLEMNAALKARVEGKK